MSVDEDSFMNFFQTIQNNLKYFLSSVVLFNFILIFFIKFSIKIKEKFVSFFEIKSIKNNLKETLLIIAHPDDEVMFFTPTLKFLTLNNCKLRILCLSNGNFYGEGKIREDEFSKVCTHLKIDFEVLNDDKLQDNIKLHWDEQYISQKINEFMKKDSNFEKIGSIITFDENGVTKHPNHISCHNGLM